ncbi:hypothetical protein PHYBOEH_008702 [Phytophthora boehmeriae]|uniref:Uncharacterized protein n=1 Tax=Phytophthora boehmeriae TaxID=109152 RepID=A0A8T1W1G0_9STRA|nr:hypothetical protein PHYBOEH_008702 [Phytophthora boehmeriae]
MPSLAEDLFERMLTLVPRRNLQSCYNKVSKDEILLVRTSVNDLLAAFTKLEEHSKIAERVGKLPGQDNVVSKKRDREERYLELRRPEKQPRVSETGPRQSGRKEVIDISDTEESESTEETGMEDGDESGDTMAEKVTVVPRQTKKSAGKNVLKISGTVAAVNSANALGNTPLTKYMRFLEEVNGLPQGERTCRIPEAFTALKDWMKGAPGFKPSGAQTTRTLQYLIMWLEAFDGQCPVLDVYRSYLDSVKTFAQLLPASRHTVAIERQLKQLATLVKNTGKTSSVVQEKVSNETSGRTKTKRRKTDSFTTLVGELYTISHDERKKRVPELLAVFKDITEDASNTSETAALFERMLTLVPRRNLQSSYNKILREGVVSVRGSLNDLLAAFAKLEDVRDAVTKLEESAGGRNPSLLATMDGTLELQTELGRSMEKWLAAITGTAVPPRANDASRKRQREERYLVLNRPEKQARLSGTHSSQAPSAPEATVDISDSEASVADDMTRKQQITFDTGTGGDGTVELDSSDSPDSDVESEAALQESRKPVTGQNKTECPSKTSEKVTNVKKSEAFWKLVKDVDDLPQAARSGHIPDVIAMLKEWMVGPGHQSSGALVFEILKCLFAWFDALEEQRPLLDLYRDCTKRVQLFIQHLPPSTHKFVLESQLVKLVTLMNNVTESSSVVNAQSLDGAVPKPVALDASVAVRAKPPVNDTFTKLVWELSTLLFDERKKRVSEVLVAFRTVTAADTSNALANRMVNDLRVVVRWINKDPREPDLDRLYGELVQAMRSFAQLIPSVKVKKAVMKRADVLSEILADKLSPKAQQTLESTQQSAAKLLAELRTQKKDNAVTRLKLIMGEMRPIVRNVKAGWIPSKDPSICQCIEIMKKRIARMKPKQRKRCKNKFASLKSEVFGPKEQAPDSRPDFDQSDGDNRDTAIAILESEKSTPNNTASKQNIECNLTEEMELKTKPEKEHKTKLKESEAALEGSKETAAISGLQNENEEGVRDAAMHISDSEESTESEDEGNSSGNMATKRKTAAVPVQRRSSKTYLGLVREVNALSQGERKKRITQVIAAVEEWMAGDIGHKQTSLVSCAIKYMIDWLDGFGGQCSLLEAYRNFSKNVEFYAHSSPASKHIGLERYDVRY